jgi:hypothetical protein
LPDNTPVYGQLIIAGVHSLQAKCGANSHGSMGTGNCEECHVKIQGKGGFDPDFKENWFGDTGSKSFWENWNG